MNVRRARDEFSTRARIIKAQAWHLCRIGYIHSMIAIATFLAATILSSAEASTPAKIEFSMVYHECTQAVQDAAAGVAGALKTCEEPARQGVPGAQYAMGALFVSRGAPADLTDGVQWLEKAIVSGSPAASYLLATVLVSRGDETSVSRARELFKSAVCAGYPPAVEALTKEGVHVDALGCPKTAETDFSGEWLLSLRWDKAAPAGPETESYRLAIEGGTPRVYFKSEDKWLEAKPGRFVMTQNDETATISVRDIGWDFDGKWIESWTIQLMRTGEEGAAVAYLRTVNNPDLPVKFAWRTFATFAEGTARRVKR
jgi:hypothetical protein